MIDLDKLKSMPALKDSTSQPRRLNGSIKNTNRNIQQESQLKKLIESRDLKPKLSNFLYTRHHNDKNTKFYDYYVRNVIDDFIDELSLSTENVTKAIAGPAGSGKSASIRNKYGLSVSPKIKEENLIIPFYFDNITEKSEKSCRDHITNQLFSAVTFLQNQFKFNFTPQSTVKFIENTKDSLVAYATIENEVLSRSDAFEIINELRNNHSLGLAISMLKQSLCTLYEEGEGVARVIFVADDLESMIDNEVVAKTVACILSMQTCMENMGDYEKPCALITLLSLRPATFETLQNNVDVNAFDIPDTAEQLHPIEIMDMFQVRLEKNTFDIEGVEERENWRTAFQIIERICTSLAHTHARFFLGITNYNIRLACKLISRVIENSHWYELVGNEEGAAYGAFKLSDNQYYMS